MSRVGKKPIPLPKGVKIKIGDQIAGEGPEGQADGADSRRDTHRAERRQRWNSCATATSMPRCTG